MRGIPVLEEKLNVRTDETGLFMEACTECANFSQLPNHYTTWSFTNISKM